ncbi:BTB/POZ domain-containing protein At3g49900 [Actinidia eriantha]|uniref:BTB/POZ domain-containing protein At3g49900 n=1 Tax=Actinidia eriantha TaxID=165200 RepID=UPI00258A0A3E|nr:BTB/POZ domain-containing protein At3g49900 [Actinidia eriantha]
MEKLRVWRDLGVVETIYEEELDDFSTSPSLSLPSTPLHCRVEAWSMATGCEADVLIHIEGSHFHLHKDPLAARSDYLRRQLNKLSEITLSPPLNITAETFALVADFCYGAHLIITPFNVAALRVAAELLEMTETNGVSDCENLQQKTEDYFRRAIDLSREYALIVLRSCLSLLPEAETTVALVSRCIEALSLLEGGDGVMSCIDDLKTVDAEDFQIVAESMQERLTGSHDLLYRIVDLYLKEHVGKITEEHKTQICNSIDLTTLSPQLLMHAVQNPRMPLRFVVQAMFVDQLHTRRSIFSSAAANNPRTAATLGAILQRDAALRQAAQLRASMLATSSRLQSLEKELESMKILLQNEPVNRRSESESGRSASFRFSSESKIERGQKGSISSASFRVFGASEAANDGIGNSPRSEREFGRKLISRLKSVFRNSKSASKKDSESRDQGKDGIAFENGDVIVIKKDVPYHHRGRSLG